MTIHINEEWLRSRLACSRAARRFTELFPNGLALTRRNLFKAARVLPVSSLLWLGLLLLQPKGASLRQWTSFVPVRRELRGLAYTADGSFVVSRKKKEAFVRALADRLELT